MRYSILVLSMLVVCLIPAAGQTPSATISGRVLDPTKALIEGATVEVFNLDTGLKYSTSSNRDGLFSITNLPAGKYRLELSKQGFRTVIMSEVTLHVQDVIALNLNMSLGSISESITVVAKANEISDAVSTVVDRQFVENLPLNGRSFQSLMQLTPGVVVVPTSDTDSGQFSVNGQRASSNTFMVDGVSANIGISSNRLATQNVAGAIPGFSVLGGTNNLVSVDALQEFRIQTSTYAPEFGRTPGAQVSIETRSGTNQFHGTLFEYLRNDVLDASDWFNGTTNPPLKKSKERQNDFGGVFGGPIFKNKTFFFFSYEGLRLRLPQTALSEVPSLAVRQDPSTPSAILPLLNAYPLPNGAQSATDVTRQLAPFAASFSNPATLNATSLRIDHTLMNRLAIFGRYDYSPSDDLVRGNGLQQPLSLVTRFAVKTETLTVGAVWSATPRITNDLRFNYSRNRATGTNTMDSFGGAVVPSESFFLPASLPSGTAASALLISGAGTVRIGPLANNLQRQDNLVESISLLEGQHSLRAGVDYRRLSPTIASSPAYNLVTTFLSVPSAVALHPFAVNVITDSPVNVRFKNLGVYVQDTWKLRPRLSFTYGLRWDVDFVPTTVDAPPFLAFTNVDNPDATAIAPPGTPLYHTKYGNFAPRVGMVYQLSPATKHETVLRGGFGVFYDLATQQTGDILSLPSFPFGATKNCFSFAPPSPACGNGPLIFPLSPALLQPPALAFDPSILVIGIDPRLKLPYTLQWNFAVEQSLSDKQVISLTYLGAVGRRLIQQGSVFDVNNSTMPFFALIGNHATSDYHALQVQFNRQMSHGLQALASYTWSHSIDSASGSSSFLGNAFGSDLVAGANRGPSDFDVRHAFSTGITYSIPAPARNAVLRSIAGGWSLDSMVQGRSATPVDVSDPNVGIQLGNSFVTVRPDLVPGQPLYLHGSFPGGKALNPAAFADPPLDPTTFLPVGQGDLGRNALRGFGMVQWDLAVRRVFPLRESTRLVFRAELFNLLNHPNFANPSGDLSDPLFGLSRGMLNKGLDGGVQKGSGFSSLYQIGGPRSGQVAFKLEF